MYEYFLLKQICEVFFLELFHRQKYLNEGVAVHLASTSDAGAMVLHALLRSDDLGDDGGSYSIDDHHDCTVSELSQP